VRPIYVPPWRIEPVLRDGVKAIVPFRELATLAARALDAAGAPAPASLGIVLSDDDELADLNAEHMGSDGPTDVLSFPLLPPGAFPPHPGQRERGEDVSPDDVPRPPRTRLHLGDVVVSVERAIDQAERGVGGQLSDRRWAAADELRLLVTHGVLHVCGWDHEATDEGAAMRALETRVLGIADAYGSDA